MTQQPLKRPEVTLNSPSDSMIHGDDTNEIRQSTTRFINRRQGALLLTLCAVGIAWTLTLWMYREPSIEAQASPKPGVVPAGQAPEIRTPNLSARYNSFDLTQHSIPLDEILKGGPPRDGIPAISKPKFTTASEATYLKNYDLVIGLKRGNTARAYPLRILVWHEIVNDSIDGEHLLITYCPLCGTAMVFSRQFDGESFEFGVSGLLYNSDVLMYDRDTESLWSQLEMEAVSGPMIGTALEWLPSELMTWSAWKQKYPDGQVLSRDTGYRRKYDRVAYAEYKRSPNTIFPVDFTRQELAMKDWIVGILIDGKAKAYAQSDLTKLGTNTLRDIVNGVPLEIQYDAEQKRVSVQRSDTEEAIPNVTAYWFAWQGFYPETDLHEPPSN